MIASNSLLTFQTFHKVTDIVIKRLLSPMKKEMKDRIDFCKYGELIKLEKMLCGDVSDAVQAVTICRKQAFSLNDK